MNSISSFSTPIAFNRPAVQFGSQSPQTIDGLNVSSPAKRQLNTLVQELKTRLQKEAKIVILETSSKAIVSSAEVIKLLQKEADVSLLEINSDNLEVEYQGSGLQRLLSHFGAMNQLAKDQGKALLVYEEMDAVVDEEQLYPALIEQLQEADPHLTVILKVSSARNSIRLEESLLAESNTSEAPSKQLTPQVIRL